MLHRLIPLGALLALPLVAPLARRAPPGPLAPDREIASLVPARSLVYVEGTGLGPILREGLQHAYVRRVLDTEVMRALLSEATQQPEDVLAFVDGLLGRPLLPTLARLSARGAALGVVPGDGDPHLVLVLHGVDAELLADTLDRAFDLVEEKLGIPGALDEPQRHLHGAEVWSLGDDLLIARRETLLVVGNDKALVSDALALAADSTGRGLLANEAFHRSHAARKDDVTLWAWADMAGLEQRGGAKLAQLRTLDGKPPVHALLGPGLAGITAGASLSAWITFSAQGLDLGLAGDGSAAARSLWPAGRLGYSSPPEAIRLEGALAEGVLYRDYAAMFRDRVELFPADTLPAFAEMITGLALFFGGKDVAEDVLPRMSPWIRVVSTRLEFEPGRIPENPLPGLALVAELDDGEVLGAEVQAAFQTLIGVLNVDRAQKADGKAMQLRMGLEGQTTITSARFLPPGPEDGVDMRYNLQPACAVVGDALILGTHEGLVRAVVRKLAAGGRERGNGPPREHLELAGTALARVVEENMETLVMQKVLDDGVTLEEAENDIGGLRLLLSTFEQAHITVDYADAGQVTLRASLRLAASADRSAR